MKACVRVLFAVALLALCVEVTWAQSEPAKMREPAPGAALGAAFANVLFVPLRLGVTVIAAGLGGFTGWMTAGNEEAAGDVWHLFRGQNYMTPEFMRGEESLYLGALEFRR